MPELLEVGRISCRRNANFSIGSPALGCSFRRVLRLVIHAVTALLLVAATVFSWNRVWRIAEGDHAIVLPEGSPWQHGESSACWVGLPGIGAAGGLHVNLHLEAESLVRGPAEWQTGRLHLEWIRDGDVVQRVFLASVWDDHVARRSSTVFPDIPPHASARLHLENLGLSGRCRLVRFEAYPVHARPMARAGLIGAAAGWLLWAASAAGSLRRPGPWLAGALWLICAHALIVPGPWETRSPLVNEFVMARPSQAAIEIPAEAFIPTDCHPGITEAPNLLLRWKLRLRPLRPLLHGLLFFVPMLGFCWGADSPRRALLLAACLACGVELAQWGFGYGFEGSDLLDLATDAIGILLALAVFTKWKHRRRCKLQP